LGEGGLLQHRDIDAKRQHLDPHRQLSGILAIDVGKHEVVGVGGEGLLHSTHACMMLSTSSFERTPSSAMKTIRVRGTPGAGVPPGASVARPPAS
jgi:hypothetical protein